MNLSYPNKQFLFNTLAIADIGVYITNTTGFPSEETLVLKNYGISLIGGSAAAATWTKQVSHPFVAKASYCVLSGTDPGSAYDYEYGIRIIKKSKEPGINNNNSPYEEGKFYGANYDYVPLSGGVITTAGIIVMENEIITQITNDAGIVKTEYGAIVEARRAYIVVDSDPGDSSGFTVTWPDATTTAFASDAAFAAGRLGLSFNIKTTAAYGGTAFNALLKAYRIDTNTYLITSINPGLLFTLGTYLDASQTSRGILIEDKFDDVSHELDISGDPTFFSSVEKLTLAKITSTDIFAVSTNLAINVNGTAMTLTAAATNINTFGLDIITNAAAAGVFASWGYHSTPTYGTIVYVAARESIGKVDLTLPYGSTDGTVRYLTALSIDKHASLNGQWSSLTADDVYRIFAGSGHHGDLVGMVRRTMPEDTEYVRFFLTGYTTTPILTGGANQIVGNLSKIELFVKKSALRALTFESANPWAGTAATANLDKILIDWSA